jgi:hypothetical protein
MVRLEYLVFKVKKLEQWAEEEENEKEKQKL